MVGRWSQNNYNLHMIERGLERTVEKINPNFRHRAKRGAGILGLGLTLGTAYGVTHASAEDPFGPNIATYGVNTKNTVVADFGPLGTMEHPPEDILPPLANLFHLGVDIKVGEIPEFAPVDDSPEDLASLLSGDAESYVQFFTHPEVIASTVAEDLIADAIEKSLLAGTGISLALAAGYNLLGNKRREELLESFGPEKRKKALASFMTLIALASCTSDSLLPTKDGFQGDAIFDGTAFEGTHVTGRLGDLMRAYGIRIMDYIENNNKYYDNISNNLTEALADYTIPVQHPDNLMTALVVSDLHCNTNMAKPLQTIQEAINNSVVINSGDTVLSGTEVEKYCIKTFASANPKGVQEIMVLGNHDSELTGQQAEDAGFIVLEEGKIITYDGMTYTGSSDPRRSDFGQEIRSTNGGTLRQQGEKLAQVACEQDNPVDVLVVHDNTASQETLDKGCAYTALTGHYHKSEDPNILENGSVEYTSGTAAGANEGMPTIESKLGATSEMSIWLFDKDTGRAAYMRTISIDPDGSVKLSAWESLLNTGSDRHMLAN